VEAGGGEAAGAGFVGFDIVRSQGQAGGEVLAREAERFAPRLHASAHRAGDGVFGRLRVHTTPAL